MGAHTRKSGEGGRGLGLGSAILPEFSLYRGQGMGEAACAHLGTCRARVHAGGAQFCSSGLLRPVSRHGGGKHEWECVQTSPSVEAGTELTVTPLKGNGLSDSLVPPEATGVWKT